MTNQPDKGKKDGSCNVTACQAPLAGTMQGYMRDHTITNGRLYYCERCCRRFNDYDDSIREPRRITWDETTSPRVAGLHEDHPVTLDVGIGMPMTEREARLQEIYGPRDGAMVVYVRDIHREVPIKKPKPETRHHVQRPTNRSKSKSAALKRLLKK